MRSLQHATTLCYAKHSGAAKGEGGGGENVEFIVLYINLEDCTMHFFFCIKPSDKVAINQWLQIK